MTKKILPSYEVQTLQALKSLTENKAQGYSVKDVTNKVVEQQLEANASLPPNDPRKLNNPSWGVLYRAAESSVSRNLSKLQQDGKIRREHTRRGLYYMCKPEEVLQMVLKEVCFTSPDVFPLSATAFLVSVSKNSFLRAQLLLPTYLGTDNCFDVFPFNGYLMFLLKPQATVDNETKNKVDTLGNPKANDCLQKLIDVVEMGYPLRDKVMARIAAKKTSEKLKKKKTKKAKVAETETASNPDSVNP